MVLTTYVYVYLGVKRGHDIMLAVGNNGLLLCRSYTYCSKSGGIVFYVPSALIFRTLMQEAVRRLRPVNFMLSGSPQAIISLSWIIKWDISKAYHDTTFVKIRLEEVYKGHN